MAILKATVSELVKGVKIKAGAKATLHLRGLRLIRLKSPGFDPGKCFPGPAALPAVKEIKKHAGQQPGCTILLAGHTDASGDAEADQALSLERAEAMAACLAEDAEAWEAWFQDGKPAAKRWGIREVQAMLSVLPGSEGKYYGGPIDGIQGPVTTAAIRKFQAAAGLTVDGIVGPKTRGALFPEYFKLDGGALPGDVKVIAHGCGASFPSGGGPAGDGRLEAFFFPDSIEPPPGADRISRPDASDYPEWLAQVLETVAIG